MSKKWDARCDSKASYLWLRNNIFYYRVELPRVNGKRRYKRVSLHTSNFFEAREKIRTMSGSGNWPFDKIRSLFNGLIYEKEDANVSDVLGVIPKYAIRRKLSSLNKKENIQELLLLGIYAMQQKNKGLSDEDRKLLEDFTKITPLIEEFMATVKGTTTKAPAPIRTISEVLETMLVKGGNCDSEQVRKRNAITRLLATVDIKLEDDYSKFHNVDTINAICKHIVSQADMKGDMKRKLIRYIKELANCGINMDSDNYKANVILNLPKVEKTKKSEKKPHLPYSEEQLCKIFDPKHTYFKDNPDAFWVCVIALFTGARANSAVTLQYDDVFKKDGIWCINFIENHPVKQLKNEASERIVPIHPQLLDLGFVEYVCNRKKQLKAKGTDFIFPRCQTKSGKYNNKYMLRVVFSFFKEIGVKAGNKDQYDFHSFRKNASLIMQDADIGATYINDIIGWEGKSTMEQSYSNHTLEQIKNQMFKFSYEFLEPYFKKWKEIFAKK